MMPKRMQHCFYCGAELGVYDNFGEPDACGERICQRELRYCYQSERAERRAKADDDDYNRY
jgi:hypothetical protein